MFKALKRWWKYLTAKVSGSLNEKADPKVQLEQALLEAQQNHRRLTEQAANVIANQKQAEMRLNRSMQELEKANTNARQAVLMADDATKKGDAAKAQQLTVAAESIANRMIQLERDVEEQKTFVLGAAEASDQAKAAVQRNSAELQRKLAERQKLLSQLDQAKMQEQLNKTMSTLGETIGEDVPTLDEVRLKIEARYAKAKGTAELQETSVDARILEIEQASVNVEAQSRLSQLRAELGLESAPAAAELGSASAEATATPAAEPATAETQPPSA
jgi:phage shock protein A